MISRSFVFAGWLWRISPCVHVLSRPIEQAISSCRMKVTGKRVSLNEFLPLLDDCPFRFNIVMP